jgi:translocator protein
MTSWLGLLTWLALCFAAAAVGGAAAAGSESFYAELTLPAWAPPASVFGPVWTFLYATMAVAAWLVWRCPSSRLRSAALALFIAQIALNALWSWLFFAWRLGAWSAIEIVLLWLLIAGTLVAFLRLRVVAGILLVPYLAWVSFAMVLNWALWRANPALLGAGLP